MDSQATNKIAAADNMKAAGSGAKNAPVEIIGKGESPEMAKRMWDSAFNDWVYHGMSEIGDQKYALGPRPGPHPDPTHEWNTDPEKYIREKLKLDTDVKQYDNRDEIEEY